MSQYVGEVHGSLPNPPYFISSGDGVVRAQAGNNLLSQMDELDDADDGIHWP